MDARRLRHRVTLESRSATADGVGGQAVTWTPVATVWAEVAPLAGREAVQAQALQARVTHRVTLRFRAGVTAAMRVVLGTRVFAIQAVRDLEERGRWLELLVEEGAAA